MSGVRASRLYDPEAIADKERRRQKRFVVSGYIWAVLFPIVGLIDGIKVARSHTPVSHNGWKIIALAFVVQIVWIALLPLLPAA